MGTERRYSHLSGDSICSLSRTGYNTLPDDGMCSRYRTGFECDIQKCKLDYSLPVTGDSYLTSDSRCSLSRTGCDWDYRRDRKLDSSLRKTGDRDTFDSIHESEYLSDFDISFLNDEDEMRPHSLLQHEDYEARNATLDLRILKEKVLLKDEKIEKMKQELSYDRRKMERTLSILSGRNEKIQQLERENTENIWEIDNLQRIKHHQGKELKHLRKEIVELEIKLSTEEQQRLDFQNEMNKFMEIKEAERMREETKLIEQIDDLGQKLNKLERQNTILYEDSINKETMLQNKAIEYNRNQQLLQNQITEKENSIRKLSETNSNLEVKCLLKDKEEETKRKIQLQEISRLERRNQELRSETDQLRQTKKDLSNKLLQQKTSMATERKESISMRHILPQIDDEKSSYKAIEEMQRQLSEKKLEIQQLLQDKKILMADLKIHQKKSDKLQEEVGQLRCENELIKKELMQEKETAKIKENECISLRKIMTRTQEDISADQVQKQLSEKNTELQKKVEQLLEELRYEKETEKKRKSHDISQLQDESQNLQKEVDRLRHDNQILNNKLRLELENFQVKEQTLKNMQHNVKTQSEEISKLKAEVVSERQMNFEHQNNIRKLLQEKKDLTKELTKKREIEESTEHYGNTTLKGVSQTLQDNVTKLRLQNQLLNDSLRQEKEKVKQIEKDTKVTNSDMQKQIEIQANEISTLKRKLKEISAQNSKTDSRVGKDLDSDQDVQKRLKDTMDQVKHLQKELDDTKSRLSRAMGDKLSDNNPNIADLSDKNRPTKISERYQELYDNQWTDAFEIINGTVGNEGNTINALRILLMDALEYCKTQAANQMNQIKETFLKGEELPVNMIKQVKDCRKAMAEQYGKGLYRDYYEQLRTSKSGKASHALKTLSYVKECFEVCWLMAVQDPPVVFGPDIRHGDTFNKDHYKAYTRSGERVDFVVWPVLLLHQNGPVLCKGVAQGK